MQIYKTQQAAGLTASSVAEDLQSALLWVYLCAERSKGFSRDLVNTDFI